jgi:DNA-directed RNA polymerase beta' subunit
MDALKVYTLFENIVDEDIIFFNMDLNLCKPVDLLITCIPAPPSCIRPTVAVSHGMKNEDDLTMKLAEIIERNKLIRQGIEDGLEPYKLMEEWYLLQCTVA